MEIRLVKPEECRQLVPIQIAAWQMEPEEAMPHHFFVSAIKTGSLIVGAYEGEKMVGFIYSFPSLAFRRERPTHEMDMMAIYPEYQRQGVAQALFQGYFRELGPHCAHWGMEPLVSGTFDPFLSHNAHIYVRKFGSIGAKFIPNMYGEMTGIYTGLRTDRFQTLFRPLGVHSQARMRGLPSDLDVDYEPDGRCINEIEFENDLPRLKSVSLEMDSDVLFYKMPYDIALMKARDLPMAVDWQRRTAEAFERYINQGGWVMTDYLRQQSPQRHNVYVLRRDVTVE